MFKSCPQCDGGREWPYYNCETCKGDKIIVAITPWKRQILIAEEKHGTRVFDATTEEALYASALVLLKERATGRYSWYIEPDEPEKPDLPEDVVAALPAGKTKLKAEYDWEEYRRNMEIYALEMGIWSDTQYAINNNNGKLAWQILRSRSDHEYEYVHLEELEGGV